MRAHHTVRLLCVVCFLCFAFSSTTHAQDDPAFTTASQPYSSYHGGDIDHVDLFSGNLNIDIPLMSYPQKGGKLNLNFALHYQSGPATATYYCDDSGDCWYQWTAFNHGWVVGPTNGLESGGFPASGTDMQSPYCGMGTDQYGNPVPEYCYDENWIQTFDQAMHQELPTSTSVNNNSMSGWRAIDGSGYLSTSNGILDSAGTLYSGGGTLLLGNYLIEPWASYPMFESFQTQITDTNGNTIKGYLTTDKNGMPWLTSWTDTMQRSIPAPTLDSPVSSQCPTSSSDPAQLSGQPNPAYSFLPLELPLRQWRHIAG